MTEQIFTIDDLRRILREAAREPEEAELDGQIENLPFDVLGYDSVALLETISRIQYEFGVELDDGALADAETPGAVVRLVNTTLFATGAA